MSKWMLLAVLGIAGSMMTPGGAWAQGAKPTPLTALDYIEIQQLNAKYAFAIDNCTNNGYDYADLYTPDGMFISGRDGGRFQGREALAEAAGGGKRGCQRKGVFQSHEIVNLIIEATPEGAKGKSYLVYPGVKGERGGPDNNGHVGGYEDTYVKTANGWRFKQRIHVHPPQIPGAYTGVPNNKAPAPAGSTK